MTSDEWAEYYERADRRRAAGEVDPFKWYVARQTARERVQFACASLLVVSLFVVFLVILMR